MPDYLNRSLKWIDHNRYFATGIVGAVLLTVFVYGCEATGNYRGEDVTATQLDQRVSADLAGLDKRHDAVKIEVAAIQRGYESLETDATAAAEEIEAEQAVFDKIASDAGTLIVGALSGNPTSTTQLAGVALGWMGLLGIGKAADKKRTDGVLARVKAANDGSLPTPPTT